jgi:hypothetical protein
MLVTRIRQLPRKPFCLPTHSHFHQPPPNLHSSPTNELTNLYTQNHATSNKPSPTLNLPHSFPLHRPYITPSNRTFGSQKSMTSHQDISLRPKKHEVSHANLVTAPKSVKSHQDISYESCAATSTNKNLSQGQLVTANKHVISLRNLIRKVGNKNATNLIRTFRNTKKA